MNLKTVTTVAALVIGVSMLPAGHVAADQKCKDVKIKVTNKAGKDVKIYKVKYYDVEDKKWRTNDIKNEKIQNGRTGSVTETLEYVGNEKIGNVQIQYKPLVGGSRVWSSAKSSGISRCGKGNTISHTI